MIRRVRTFETRAQEEVQDITEDVNNLLRDENDENVEAGVCHLFILHTAAALGVADLDPGTDKDYLDAFREMVPKLPYRHPHDPSHVGDHVISTLVGASLALPFERKKLILGTWQRVVLC